jgi:hypothetical protein
LSLREMAGAPAARAADREGDIAAVAVVVVRTAAVAAVVEITSINTNNEDS